MATIRFTDDDRDKNGFIRLSPPAAEVVSDPPPPAPPAPPAALPRPPLSPRLRYQLTMAGAAIAGLLLVLASVRFSAAPSVIGTATIVATLAATSAPAATLPTGAPATAQPVVMLDAYAAPNEAPEWQIEATRAITPTAHYGSQWIQADVAGSGLLWLRASDVPDLEITGPDLAPRPTARPLPTATPEPQPPCLNAGTGAHVVTVCDWLDPEELRIAAAAKWVATYGGSIGTVLTPSPQVREP